MIIPCTHIHNRPSSSPLAPPPTWCTLLFLMQLCIRTNATQQSDQFSCNNIFIMALVCCLSSGSRTSWTSGMDSWCLHYSKFGNRVLVVGWFCFLSLFITNHELFSDVCPQSFAIHCKHTHTRSECLLGASWVTNWDGFRNGQIKQPTTTGRHLATPSRSPGWSSEAGFSVRGLVDGRWYVNEPMNQRTIVHPQLDTHFGSTRYRRTSVLPLLLLLSTP